MAEMSVFDNKQKMKKILSTLLVLTLASTFACTQQQESITFETSRPDGAEIFLGIDAAPENRDQIWIDLNANGSKDEGEGVTTFYYDNITSPAQDAITENSLGAYIISAQKITIYGPVMTFTCRSSGISAIDLSRVPSLKTLVCHHNQIKSLDLSCTPLLDTLNCEGNWISDIDLSPIPDLTYLNVSYNKLNKLDLSHSKKLSTLRCRETGLTVLDLSKNEALTSLYLINNGIDQLDLSHNPALSKLICMNEKIQSLDLRHNKSLVSFHCYNCPLTDLGIASEGGLLTLFIPHNMLEQKNLEKLFEQLPATPGILCVEGNPGAPTADRTIVISKGWGELTKKELDFSEF